MTTTERRRRSHPARGARWFSAGLAVAGTLGIATYLEIDARHAAASDEVVVAASRVVPGAPSVQLPTAPAPSATVTVPPAPTATIVPSTRSGNTRSSAPRSTQRTTHARSMGSPG